MKTDVHGIPTKTGVRSAPDTEIYTFLEETENITAVKAIMKWEVENPYSRRKGARKQVFMAAQFKLRELKGNEGAVEMAKRINRELITGGLLLPDSSYQMHCFCGSGFREPKTNNPAANIVWS